MVRVVSISFSAVSLLAAGSLIAACSAETQTNTEAATPPVAPAETCERTADMPPGLKLERYRGVTPACVPNGRTLDVTGLQALLSTAQPVLIDVWAIIRSVDDGFGSRWLQNEEHYSLPGAVWLPNVGYGQLQPDVEQYLQNNLQRLTAGDKDRALVFFCVADCWMSWNTVQRVRDYGYTQVYWYKDGTDGWDEAGLPLTVATPVELVSVESD